MTKTEVRWRDETINRKKNFGTILALSAAALFGVGMVGPALMLPGVLINGYYTGKSEYNKHGESWRKRVRKAIPIFKAKDHHGHGGHDDHGHGGGHH